MGLPVKVERGVKVIAPVVVFTVQVPSFGTSSGAPAVVVPTIFTLAGFNITPVSPSLPSTESVTGLPVIPVAVSGLTIGG